MTLYKNFFCVLFFLSVPLVFGEGQTMSELKAAAESGDVKAQNELGTKYLLGDGVEKNEQEAVKWLRKAAEQGKKTEISPPEKMESKDDADVTAAAISADIKEWASTPKNREEFLENNHKKKLSVWKEAAEQGNAEAQVLFGWCHYYGIGVSKDHAESVKWLRKAAEQRLAIAQTHLGWHYANGEGVSKDAAEAVKWYRKAAEQGYAMAQYNLGVCYRDGEGVSKDPAEAVKWFRRAAEQGYAMAQNNLGVCYNDGVGVSKDETEAIKWYQKAAKQGNVTAQKNLDIIRKELGLPIPVVPNYDE